MGLHLNGETASPKEGARMPDERELVHKSRDFDGSFPASVIKQAQTLFMSYLDDEQKSRATFFRMVTITDGERIKLKTDEDFYFRHEDTVNTRSSFLGVVIDLFPIGPSLDIISVHSNRTSVDLKLPSRDHVDNVLAVFARAESQMRPSALQVVNEQGEVQARVQPDPPPKLTIFIGHGHDPQWERLRDFLKRDNLLNVVFYESGSRAGLETGSVVLGMSDEADMAFIVHTGEDEDRTGAKRARENVVHEAGIFQAKLGFNRAIVVLEEGCSEYSNIKGIAQIRFAKGQIDTIFGDVLLTILREFPGRL
jgi:predicted nucleotide-binding protein